jgi:hypothetical protein
VTGRLLAAVAATCLVCICASSAGAADLQTSAVLFADPGAQINQSTTQRFDSADGGRVTATVADGSPEPAPARSLGITLSGATIGAAGPIELGFSGAAGDVLTPGMYPDADGTAEGLPVTDPHIIMIVGSEELIGSGAFEIKDLAVDGSGLVQRLWLVFEFRPQGDALASVFGEIRINEPGSVGPLQAEPTLVRWPALDLGQQATSVPVTIAAAAAGPPITSVAVTGADAAEFPIEQDGCTGVTLAAGDTCQVWVDFAPTTAGVGDATLEVTDADESTEPIPLEGLAHGGATFLKYASQAGDYVGDGYSSLATTAEAWTFFVTGSFDPADTSEFPPGGTSSLSLDLDQGFTRGDSASVELTAPPGHLFAVGTTYPAGSGANFLATSGDRACGAYESSFTLTDLSFYSDGRSHSFAANFIQRCTDQASAAAGYPALCGEVSWHVGDTQPPDLYSPPNSGSDTGTQVPSDTGIAGTACAPPAPADPGLPGGSSSPAPSASSPAGSGTTGAAPVSASTGTGAAGAGSSKTPKLCLEPSLARHTLSWAKRALEHAGCRAETRRIAARTSLRGRVVRASGHPRERLAFGHAVILDIGH